MKPGLNPDMMFQSKPELDPQAFASPIGGKPLVPETANKGEAKANVKNENQGTLQDLAVSLATLGAAAKALTDSLPKDPQNVKALQAENALQEMKFGKDFFPQNGALQASAVKSEGFGKSAGGKEENSFAEKGSSLKPDQTALTEMGRHQPTQFKEALSTATLATGAGSAAAHAAGMDSDRANTQQLINGAQYLIKKGGGEASIQMSPEGMGQVHLKIAVMDGKVSLQMSAENNETKKLLESSISELKNSLSAHKMELSTIKIDSSEIQQGKTQMDMRSDLNREQARQFLGQFRDENLNRRNDFFYETPAMKAYGSGRQLDPLQPAPVATSARRSSGSGKGSGLDLVA